MVERWGRSGTPRLKVDSIWKFVILKKFGGTGPRRNPAFGPRTPLHSNFNWLTATKEMAELKLAKPLKVPLFPTDFMALVRFKVLKVTLA